MAPRRSSPMAPVKTQGIVANNDGKEGVRRHQAKLGGREAKLALIVTHGWQQPRKIKRWCLARQPRKGFPGIRGPMFPGTPLS